MAKIEFGKRIAQLRRELAAETGKDIGQADVARHMEISRSAYAQWENGLTRPRDIGTYRRLAEYLRVGLADLGVDVAEMTAEADLPKMGHKPANTATAKKGRRGA